VAEIPVMVEAELARLRAENARLLAGRREGGVLWRAVAARTDVYATRYDNQRTGKSGWVPAVRGGWQKGVRHEVFLDTVIRADGCLRHLVLQRHLSG
jgi:hypothetical protein